MAEGLQTLDGEAIKLDPAAVEQEFAKAMSAPADEPPAPPKREKPADGEPKAPRRGRPPRTARNAPAAAPPKQSPEADKSRAEGVKGMCQIAAGLALVMDQRTPDDNVAFRADAVVLSSAAEPLAEACVDVAKHNAQFAAILDKLTKVGPYGALVTVGLSIGGQIARNHGVKAAEMLGAVSPEDLLKQFDKAEPEAEPQAA